MGRLKLIYFLLLLSHSASCALSPVILVPGDGGSQLEAKLSKPSVVHYLCTKTSDWFDLWLNMELLVPVIIDCWVDNMRLMYDNVTRTTRNSPGVETRVPGFGNSSTVEWLDPSQRSPTGYFKDIVNSLIPDGYKRDITVRGAPFDFRKAPNELGEYFKDLKHLIENTFYSVNEQVVLIAHSMGGPVLHNFLAHQPQRWKDKYIRAVIALSGAWGGAVKAAKVYSAGDNLGVYVISSKSVREEQRSAPSLAFLLPSSQLWGPDEVLVQTPEVNYTTANMKGFFQALNLPDAYEMYLDTRDLNHNLPPPGVEVHCLHGIGVPTVEKLVYAKGTFPDSPVIVNGDGDGTVNLRSAQMCLQWNGKQKKKVYYKTFKGVDHMNILRAKDVIEYVRNFLKQVELENEKELENRRTREWMSVAKLMDDKSWVNHIPASLYAYILEKSIGAT